MWRWVGFDLAGLLAVIYGLGWLTAEGPERYRYRWLTLTTVVLAYFWRPWV